MKISEMVSQNKWITCCFFNFLIAASIGLFLRFIYLFPINTINYTFLLHAHSHTAMLGWVYMMIYALIVRFFIPKEKKRKPIYNQLFWCTQFSVIGMMISFPIQGYGMFSIVFSTLHILLSYIFCVLVWKDCLKERKNETIVLQTAIFFMIFSTLGVWCLGPTISRLGKQSDFYQIAIQFFLHFQFNGWFLFAVLALYIKQFSYIDKTSFKKFLIMLISATFLTAAFPINWYIKNGILSWINTLGVLLQLGSFVYFCKMLQPQISTFKAGLDATTKIVYGFALCSLLLKISLQLLVLIPNLAEASNQIRNFVVGFIHLTTLGIITGFLFGILLQNKILSSQSYFVKLGMKCFMSGYVSTEVLLFLQGGLFYLGNGKLPGYFESIFIAAFLILSGIILVLISILNKKQELIN